MGFDEDEPGFFQNKWVIVGIIVVILIVVNIALFMKYVPGNFFGKMDSTANNNAEKQVTVVGNSGAVTDTDSTPAPNTPQKIGSATVSAGSMEQIEIKG